MKRELLSAIRPAIVIFAGLTLLTGVVYPAVVTFIGGTLFPRAARGSLIEHNGQVIGSELIGQAFDDERYFWGRPSATTAFAYNAAASSGSNLGPTNPALVESVTERVRRLKAAHPDQSLDVPIDLATASASGLDPHISPAAAYYQVERVAANRGLTAESVRALVEQQSEGRTLGLLGEPRVNVLQLNLALDSITSAGSERR